MTTAREPLGIRRIDAIHYYVHDLARSRRFYTEKLDFAEVAASGPELQKAGRQASALFRAGDVNVLVSQPLGEGGRAWRYLRKHPDGIGSVVFEVEDVDHTFRVLEERGATPVTDVQTFHDDGGTLRTFNITTPLADTTFRYVERRGYRGAYPGMTVHATPKGGTNRLGFGQVDHLTSNFQTMKPALLWMEHVLGMSEFWEVKFHTQDAASARRAALQAQKGSGLRSVVMKDLASGVVKFANNEPWRPAFKSSQINLFNEDHRGDGVQHLALTVKDILSAVKEMREKVGVQFMPTPGTYYDALPERIQHLGIKKIDEDINVLRNLQILVDGDKEHSYLLQIFMKDAASLYKDPAAGPFFYEIIQRKGDQGFGGGNFRALFESIERQQKSEGRI
jgi:4-hydroxyphenylpyruvate dioxygenase